MNKIGAALAAAVLFASAYASATDEVGFSTHCGETFITFVANDPKIKIMAVRKADIMAIDFDWDTKVSTALVRRYIGGEQRVVVVELPEGVAMEWMIHCLN